MEDKKVTKISLSTFFLIIAIIIICIMGYFLYRSANKTSDIIEKEKELNAKIEKMEEEIANKEVTTIKADQKNYNNNLNSKESKDTASNNMSFSSLKGKYVGNADVEPGTTPDGETEVNLYLYENGSYSYNNMPGFAAGHIGYYTVDGNNLILHEIIECANDIGRTITSNTITLKINNDKSITDNELNAVLKKSNSNVENENNIISTELKNALNNKSLN